MKKWIAGMLAISMLLLPGCQDKQQDPTETNFVAPVLTAEDCLRDRQTLSYEEFFGEDRIYTGGGSQRHISENSNQWLIPAGEDYILFTASYEKYFGITVASKAYEASYTVPGSEKLAVGELIQADGKWAYMQYEHEILQIDMATGETASLVQYDYCFDYAFCGRDVLYYAAVKDGVAGVYRLYIPTRQRTVLSDRLPPDMFRDWFGFYFLSIPSTQGEVTWHTLNPEMWQILKEDLADPDSRYKSEVDYAGLWYPEGGMEGNMLYCQHLMVDLQKDTGVLALMKGIYDQKTDTYSEKEGIIDYCWVGSDPGHDHFEPEITSMEPPTLDLGEWTSVPGLTPMEAAAAEKVYAGENGEPPYKPYVYSEGLLPCLLGREDQGRVTVLDEIRPCKEYPAVSYYYALAPDYIYYVTPENTLARISYDGSVRQTLYEAKCGKLDNLVCEQGMLFLLDGDTLIQMDIPAAQYRTVLTYEDITTIYISNQGNENALYLIANRGLAFKAARFYITSEKLEETNYYI